jgi:DNA-binding transcriptional LysR family regulator
MSLELNWDEFRVIMAIAESKSLVGAAAALGLNHSTVFRRLAAIEAAIGEPLFDRARSGYRPTAAGEEMIELARAMRDSVGRFQRRLAGRDVEPGGEVSVTAEDAFAFYILPPILARFRQSRARVRMRVNASRHDERPKPREGEVALRAAREPIEGAIGRKILKVRSAVYHAPEFARRWGAGLWESAPWIGLDDTLLPPEGRRWLEQRVGEPRIAARFNSLLGMAKCAALGVGAAILPCFIGDRASDLERAGEPRPEFDVDLWLLADADPPRSERTRAFMDHAIAELTNLRPLFEGELAKSR